MPRLLNSSDIMKNVGNLTLLNIV